MTPPNYLSPLDREALDLCLQTVLRGPDKRRAAQLAEMMRERGRQYAAEFASYNLQCDALHLRPWETPPALFIGEPDNSPAGRLLQRMLDAGLSRFHRDPTEALDGRPAGSN